MYKPMGKIVLFINKYWNKYTLNRIVCTLKKNQQVYGLRKKEDRGLTALTLTLDLEKMRNRGELRKLIEDESSYCLSFYRTV